jgi:hypothetical protein
MSSVLSCRGRLAKRLLWRPRDLMRSALRGSAQACGSKETNSYALSRHLRFGARCAPRDVPGYDVPSLSGLQRQNFRSRVDGGSNINTDLPRAGAQRSGAQESVLRARGASPLRPAPLSAHLSLFGLFRRLLVRAVRTRIVPSAMDKGICLVREVAGQLSRIGIGILPRIQRGYISLAPARKTH